MSGVGGGGRTGVQQSLGGSGEAETLSLDLAAHRLQFFFQKGALMRPVMIRAVFSQPTTLCIYEACFLHQDNSPLSSTWKAAVHVETLVVTNK